MIPSLEPLEKYAEKVSWAEPAVLRRLREETYRTRKYPQMIAGPLQGRLLAQLAKIARAKRVLEVGTFVGYGALCFAEALPAGGEVITLDRDPSVVKIATRYFAQAPYGRKIKLMIGKALPAIQSLKGAFDIVYIDADKPNYGRYYDAVFPKLRRGGLILADNILWSGSVLDPKVRDAETQALRAFAGKVRRDRRVEPVLLTVRDGLLLVRKK
jgi:caffeoyl-CoA O-methyltransferase